MYSEGKNFRNPATEANVKNEPIPNENDPMYTKILSKNTIPKNVKIHAIN